MLKLINPALMAAVIALLIGCENQSEQPTTGVEPVSTAPPTDDSAAEETSNTAASEPSDDRETNPSGDKSIVEIAEWDEIMETVSSSKKPAVLDVWSLVCQPCLEEFPGLVRLHNELGEQVACYSADVDFDGRKTRPPEFYRPHVETFLTEVDAADAFPHFICSTSSDEVFTKLDIDSIPTVVVLNADGTIAKKFVDAGETAGFTYDDDVTPFVKSLLEKQ